MMARAMWQDLDRALRPTMLLEQLLHKRGLPDTWINEAVLRLEPEYRPRCGTAVLNSEEEQRYCHP